MHTINKYDLALYFGEQQVSLPEDAIILKIAMQDGFAQIWAFVDTTAGWETRTFVIKPTGGEIVEVDRIRYLETLFSDGLVWHVCELDDE